LSELAPSINTGHYSLVELVTENIRFILWQTGRPNWEWAALLRDWLNIKLPLAIRMVEGGELPNSIHLDRLQEVSGLGDEQIQFSKLVGEIDVLSENLKFLLGEFPRGGLKQFAYNIGVDQNTVSRWRGGGQMPNAERQKTIVELLGLPSGTILKESPLFLSLSPISIGARKQWLKAKIDEAAPDLLADVFPVMERLFKK